MNLLFLVIGQSDRRLVVHDVPGCLFNQFSFSSISIWDTWVSIATSRSRIAIWVLNCWTRCWLISVSITGAELAATLQFPVGLGTDGWSCPSRHASTPDMSPVDSPSVRLSWSLTSVLPSQLRLASLSWSASASEWSPLSWMLDLGLHAVSSGNTSGNFGARLRLHACSRSDEHTPGLRELLRNSCRHAFATGSLSDPTVWGLKSPVDTGCPPEWYPDIDGLPEDSGPPRSSREHRDIPCCSWLFRSICFHAKLWWAWGRVASSSWLSQLSHVFTWQFEDEANLSCTCYLDIFSEIWTCSRLLLWTLVSSPLLSCKFWRVILGFSGPLILATHFLDSTLSHGHVCDMNIMNHGWFRIISCKIQNSWEIHTHEIFATCPQRNAFIMTLKPNPNTPQHQHRLSMISTLNWTTRTGFDLARLPHTSTLIQPPVFLGKKTAKVLLSVPEFPKRKVTPCPEPDKPWSNHLVVHGRLQPYLL